VPILFDASDSLALLVFFFNSGEYAAYKAADCPLSKYPNNCRARALAAALIHGIAPF
jgi:hypothetical protein